MGRQVDHAPIFAAGACESIGRRSRRAGGRVTERPYVIAPGADAAKRPIRGLTSPRIAANRRDLM
jgi:hypothetical protein